VEYFTKWIEVEHVAKITIEKYIIACDNRSYDDMVFRKLLVG